MWHLWTVVGPLLPVALALVLLRTRTGRIAGAGLVGAGQAAALSYYAAEEDPTSYGFAVAFLPAYATAAVVGAGVVERIVLAQLRRPTAPGPASFGDRVAAVVVDTVVVGLVAWRTAESVDGPGEVAGPIAFGVAYLTVGGACGGTVGHRALGLRVVRADADRPLRAGPALVRAAVVFVEVAAALTCFGAFLVLADLASLSEPDGRSFGDRLTRSRVVRAARHTEPD